MRVDFLNNPRTDLRTLVLGGLGLSAGYIAAVTGLSIPQVTYRLRKGGVHISDYRVGTGMAQDVLRRAEPLARQSVLRRLPTNNHKNGSRRVG